MTKKRNSGRTEAGGRPPEVLAVLQESAEARKEYFKNYKAGHKRILELSKELSRLIYEPLDTEVIYLLGPTGVGKSTLMLYVIAELYRTALPELKNVPGRVPTAFIEAENPDTGSYEWRSHYISTMLALNEVLIDRKVYLPSPADTRDLSNESSGTRVGGRAALRRAAQKALKNRIMYAFFVDEAHYITKRKSGEGLMNQADTIRSIASRSGTLHVLVGNYALRHLRNLNAQLARRSHTIHFQRYRTEGLSEEEQMNEINAFSEAFINLQAHLPVIEQPDLTRHMEFCFTRTLGCVGRLKSWFGRSLNTAVEKNSKTITSDVFLKAAISKADWRQAAQEIKDGEEALNEADEELEAELARAKHADDQPETIDNSRSSKAKRKEPESGGNASPTQSRVQ